MTQSQLENWTSLIKEEEMDISTNGFQVPEGHRVKIWKMKVIAMPILIRVLGRIAKKTFKRKGGTRNPRKNWNWIDHSTSMIDKNTCKSSGEPRLAVTWISMETTSYYKWEKIVRNKMMKIIMIIFLDFQCTTYTLSARSC